MRLADMNGDGREDIVTGWEEGGIVRAYLHPGSADVRNRWPAVTVGKAPSVEDAVLVDLDADGAVDVVSASEGKTRALWAHWAPAGREDYRDDQAWSTEAFPALGDAGAWMYTLPMQIDGQHGVDIVVGGKNDGAQIGWLRSPENPRDLAAWQWFPLLDAGWIMSLIAADMDEDGDLDVLASDRKGASRGCLWLENPGPGDAQTRRWKEHRIGPRDREILFIDLADLDGDKRKDVIAATLSKEWLYIRRTGAGDDWETHSVSIPDEAGMGKGIRAGDIDGDGRLDVVLSCEQAAGKMGVMWFSYGDSPLDTTWRVHDISGKAGTKFDLVQLLDLDDDGDLDVLTCEERENLGVIWYENPRF